jgi:branched-chain amino acid transport system substrate-binding protein
VRSVLPRFTGTKVAASAAVVLGVSVLAACTSSSTSSGTTSASNSNTPIVIGASLSLDSSPNDTFQTDGLAFQKGYELWAKDVNEHGGLLGRKVVLKILDDGSSPNQVVTNYQTLFGKDHVPLAFGPFSSLLSGPASAVAARYGMAFVEGAGGAPSVFDTASNQADHDTFDVSLPIADEMVPLYNWLKSLPPSERPKTAAYPMAQDPFADPPVELAQTLLSSLGIHTVYSNIFTETESAYKAPAQAVAASGAQLVVLGSTDVPTVQTFMQVFQQEHYTPKLFIAASGPDQGSAFVTAVGQGNENGVMVPNGWYPGIPNQESQQMVQEYVAQYHVTPSDINADVAEAYSVGQVVAQAVTATHSTDNAKIIAYLHSGVTLHTVQGDVTFDALGENGAAAAFVFQWQQGKFVQVLPSAPNGPAVINKTPWNDAGTTPTTG